MVPGKSWQEGSSPGSWARAGENPGSPEEGGKGAQPWVCCGGNEGDSGICLGPSLEPGLALRSQAQGSLPSLARLARLGRSQGKACLNTPTFCP